MHQRTLISEPEQIRRLSKGIHFFSSRKQMFKVQLNGFSDKENYKLEKRIVRYYSLGQHALLGALPPITILIYLFFVLSGLIPYLNLGIVLTILLYVPFAALLMIVCRVLVTFYARRSLHKLAEQLEDYHELSWAG